MTDNANPTPEFWATPPATIGGGANLTADQAREMAVEMVKHGGLTREAADAALKTSGHEPAPADTRSEEAKTFDKSFAPAPSEMKVDFMGRIPPGTTTNALAEFNQVAGEWVAGIGLPAAIGKAVIETSLEHGRRMEGMTPAARELFKREQGAMFDRVAKTPERAAQLRVHAETALARAPAGFTAGLRQSGALDDASILMNLALHGERLAIREKL